VPSRSTDIEKGDAGVSFGAKERKLGIKGSPTREVYLDNVRIPADRMIGADDPEYGRLVCFCERVTAGEIRDIYVTRLAAGRWSRRTYLVAGKSRGLA